ncbi:MAG: hypothetical protein PHR77_13950 [Kiritimatiellae bacterium]|nr:hypothetical protein [Kiritimatiellia bacterium]MDD5521360.1 hypothetical protein [Kiritimatiellia bacterium]
MADIELKCPKCSATMVVSEFADHGKLTCHACGEPFVKPDVASQNGKPSVRKLTFAKQAPEQAPEENLKPTKWQISQQAAKEKRPKQGFQMTHLLWSSIIFLLLGGTMAYLRYGGGYLSNNRDLIRLYGPIIIITIHIIILLKAFKDSVFQGVLCLLIPLYSFYYIFSVSDDFYMRAIVGGLLIGIGQDSFFVFNEEIQKLIKVVNDWIASGG